MATTTRLVTRGRTFYFRAAVPKDLRSFAGRSEVKISLRTSVQLIANMRSRVISNHVDIVIAKARKMAQAQNIEVDNAVRGYFRDALEWGQEFTDIFAPDPEVDIDDSIEHIETRLTLLRRRLAARAFPKDVQSRASDIVGAIPQESLTSRFEALQRAQAGQLRADIEADRLLLAKLSGDYTQTDILDPLFLQSETQQNLSVIKEGVGTGQPNITPPDAPTLNELAEQYEKVLESQNLKQKTLGNLRLSFELARAVIEFDKPANQLCLTDMKALRDLIGEMPAHHLKKPETRDLDPVAAVQAGKDLPKLGYETQKKRFDFFKRFAAWMVAEEHLSKVPGSELKLLTKKPPKGKPKRLPYEPEQLVTIFNTPIYTGRKSTLNSGVPGNIFIKDGRYWVPLIALYAGMRSGEIIQLLHSDIRQDSGIWYFDITKTEADDGEQIKNLKTGSSYRRVPIHSAIIALGLLEFVASRKSGRLFSELPLGSDGTYSQPWSKFWYNLGNSWKFRTPLHVFHSFRHNFVDALHEANVTDAIAMQLCGHTNDDAHWSYGKGASIARLKEEVDKVEYLGLHLDHATGPSWQS